MDCCKPGFPVLHYSPELLKLTSIELIMPFNHLILCCPLLILPSIFPSMRIFSNEIVCGKTVKAGEETATIFSQINEDYTLDQIFFFLAVLGTFQGS